MTISSNTDVLKARLHWQSALPIAWRCGLQISPQRRRGTSYPKENPGADVVKMFLASNSFALALISSTSQLAQMNFPLRKAPSGLASQTEKCAES
jgi:hypothetical protein